MWVTKKKLREDLAHAEQQIQRGQYMYNELMASYIAKDGLLKDMLKQYPFALGQVVYDLQLRSSKGRFTKTKASREHSLINEVVVDKKNYFGLVDRYASNDVFTDRAEAEKYLESVCIE